MILSTQQDTLDHSWPAMTFGTVWRMRNFAVSLAIMAVLQRMLGQQAVALAVCARGWTTQDDAFTAVLSDVLLQMPYPLCTCETLCMPLDSGNFVPFSVS